MATATCSILSEKRIEKFSLRLSDTLKDSLRRRAHAAGTTMSDYIVHLAAMADAMQEEACRTSPDIIKDARKALDLVEAETEELTAYQRIWASIRLTKAQLMILAGKRSVK